MKFSGSWLLAVVIAAFTLISCQKELDFTDSVGSLVDSSGSCRSAVVGGTYRADSILGLGNYADVLVDVETQGTYFVVSDTINGYYFKGGGAFSTTGLNTVRLYAYGKPMQPGTNIFTLKYSGTTCSILVTVLPSAAPTAQFVLGANSGTCTGVIIGSYVQGTAMNVSNTVVQDVTVNITGPFRIYTDTLNGVHFAVSGVFTNTGVQTVELVGYGTPSNAGAFTYTVRGGVSTCTFQITYQSAATANTDYFPTSLNSWWTYDSEVSAPDSLYKKVNSTVVLAGNNYSIFNIGQGAIGTGSIGAGFYRKSASDYFQYMSLDSFSTVSFDAPVLGEVLFLKENALPGTSWESAVFSGTEAGINVEIKYRFTVVAIGASYTVNGTSYNNYIKITANAVVSRNGSSFADDTDMECVYAKGVGLIEFKLKPTGSSSWALTEQLKHYLVY